jgi:HK97 family phage major capsid protein
MTKHFMPQPDIEALCKRARPAGVLGDVRNDAEFDPDRLATVMAGLRDELSRVGNDVTKRVEAQQRRIEALETRNADLEQKLAGGSRRGAFGGEGGLSVGQAVTSDAAYAAFVRGGSKGNARITVNQIITGTSVPIFPDQDRAPIAMPRRRLLIRALLGQGRTTSSSVEYFKQTVRTNNAAVVAEGAQKAESNFTWSKETANVRTIAHWVPTSRQAMDDSGVLGSLIDGELRYGLALAEETELLYGDGTGEHLDGMVPQATPFNPALITEAMDTRYDVIRHAIAQAATADLPASGIILNLNDWFAMMGIKDEEGRYIGAGPFGTLAAGLWTLPVAATNAMNPGEFLVGAFDTATTLWDRMDAEVLVSSEDRDNFIKNALTVRGEERLAFAVKKPAALIHGDFADVGL